MNRELFKISGGYVYDPANGLDGQVHDLWIENGRIIEAPQDPHQQPTRTLNATGLVVMPGGIDLHCHIAGPKVNIGRKMRPEERRDHAVVPRTQRTRSGTLGSVPSTFATGYKYLGLGYTTAFDAAIPPLSARHAHEELADTPCIDKGFYVLMGNNHFVLQAIADRDPERLRAFVGWLLGATKGYAAKLVNPGGVEVWKQQQAGNVSGIDDVVGHFNVTPRQIIREVSQAVDALGLPHATHVHCNNLGMPGNWHTTLATMQALEGHRGHITHIQFHSYGGGDADEDTFRSQVEPLANYVNTHPNITVDVGQVLFGDTTSMTGDGPLGYYLSNVYGTKWFSDDTELESGCGIVPITYRNKSLVHALQWAIGLEWFLMVQDPWQVAMSTDHPNGGSFLAYPQIIRLLMDRTYRQDILRNTPQALRERCQLADLDREYSLSEIAIITRAAPARMLGLRNKGHLGPGADADISIYTPHEDKEQMFSLPRYAIKAGTVIAEEGDIRQESFGKLLHVAPPYDPQFDVPIADWFEQHYTIRLKNYMVQPEELADSATVPCELPTAGRQLDSSETPDAPAVVLGTDEVKDTRPR